MSDPRHPECEAPPSRAADAGSPDRAGRRKGLGLPPVPQFLTSDQVRLKSCFHDGPLALVDALLRDLKSSLKAAESQRHGGTLLWIDQLKGALLQVELLDAVLSGAIEPGTEPLTDAELAAKLLEAVNSTDARATGHAAYLKRAAARLQELSDGTANKTSSRAAYYPCGCFVTRDETCKMAKGHRNACGGAAGAIE